MAQKRKKYKKGRKVRQKYNPGSSVPPNFGGPGNFQGGNTQTMGSGRQKRVDTSTLNPSDYATVDREDRLQEIMDTKGVTREQAITNQSISLQKGYDINQDGVVTNQEFAAIRDAGLLNVYDTDPAGAIRPPSSMQVPEAGKITPAKLSDVEGIKDPSEVFTVDEPTSEVTTDFRRVEAQVMPVAPTATAITKTAATAGPAAQAKAPTPIEAARMDAAIIDAADVPTVDAAQGELSEGAIADERVDQALTERAQAATRDTAQEQAALAQQAAQYEISDGSYVDRVTGDVTTVAPTAEAERNERERITGAQADEGQAAEIIDKVGYEAALARQVKGTAAKGAAAEMVAAVGELPPAITAAIVEDPATVEVQVDNEPIEVRAAIAALPTEALVSSQMETLLGGIEDGEVPIWAKSAVEQVNTMMRQRGLNASTVGRDALFNAIIASAMPLAQANAQALQQRAAQNLSNEQQAAIQQSNLNAQRRLQNVANSQTAASQTAQMAQSMATMQSQFAQDAVITSAAQAQQTRVQNLQNRQQTAIQNVQNLQASNAQNLGNEQQVNLAELQIEAQTEGANQAAANQ